jgi:hypothetical protein
MIVKQILYSYSFPHPIQIALGLLYKWMPPTFIRQRTGYNRK